VRAGCTVEGCTARAHGQGLCNKHLQRIRKRGTTDAGRTYPQREGLLHQNDLYPQWSEFKRTKNTRPVIDAWRDDFQTFVDGVGGERPSRAHRLYPIDRDQPMGPDNFQWRESLVTKLEGESTTDYGKRHQKAHKQQYPALYKHHALRRTFGPDFGFDEFSAMAEAQNNRCAICGEKETAVRKGALLELAMDHCHDTGRLRQLTCLACNTGMGKFKHSPKLFRAAIAYLVKHGTDPES
jgi:hypothetical protein